MRYFKKIWDFIWNDDSILSWLVNVFLAIIIFKFLIYASLGFLLNTSFPVVDVVVFSAGAYSAPIIHRVVDKTENGVGTKGDHNIDQNSFEKDIKKDKLLGKAVFRIPYLGWVKVIFSEIIGG